MKREYERTYYRSTKRETLEDLRGTFKAWEKAGWMVFVSGDRTGFHVERVRYVKN